MADCNISVSVRVRELIRRELSDDLKKHWKTCENKSLLQVDPATSTALCQPYVFDRVYNEASSNADVYEGKHVWFSHKCELLHLFPTNYGQSAWNSVKIQPILTDRMRNHAQTAAEMLNR